MKINSELERVLHAEQAKYAKPKSVENSASFDDVLQGALHQSEIANQNQVAMSVNLAPTASLQTGSKVDVTNENLGENSAQQSEVHAIINHIEHSMNGFNTYANSIAQDKPDFKQAWQNLNTFNQSVSELRQNYTNLPQKNSSLDSMINDLEIMSVTETYKFNRGDYL